MPGCSKMARRHGSGTRGRRQRGRTRAVEEGRAALDNDLGPHHFALTRGGAREVVWQPNSTLPSDVSCGCTAGLPGARPAQHPPQLTPPLPGRAPRGLGRGWARGALLRRRLGRSLGDGRARHVPGAVLDDALPQDAPLVVACEGVTGACHTRPPAAPRALARHRGSPSPCPLPAWPGPWAAPAGAIRPGTRLCRAISWMVPRPL